MVGRCRAGATQQESGGLWVVGPWGRGQRKEESISQDELIVILSVCLT